MKKCKDCGQELKYIAGGISKKGNRYQAFWGCKDKDCKYSEEPTAEEVKKYDLEARMNKMEEEQIRFKEMAWFNATKGAVEMMKGQFLEANKTVDSVDGHIETHKEGIKYWRNFLYKEHMEWFIRDIINEED